MCLDNIVRLSTDIEEGSKAVKNAMVIGYCTNYKKKSAKNMVWQHCHRIVFFLPVMKYFHLPNFYTSTLQQ